MTYLITDILLLDFNKLDNTNLKGKGYTIKPSAFAGKTGSRVLFGDSVEHNSFKLILGLLDNFKITNNKLYGDLTVYDINGFDVELGVFIETAIETNALIIRPLINIIKKDEKLKEITEADVENFMVFFVREYG